MGGMDPWTASSRDPPVESSREKVGLILFVAQFHDGALHRLHTGFFKQTIEIVEATLLGSESDPNSGQIAVAGLTNQTFTTLGEILMIDSGGEHDHNALILHLM
jgi:hypothetical protein